jgi:peptide/nickel transport system substrate-binding protein
LAALLAAGGACRGPDAPPGALVVAFDSDPQSLDPRYQTDANAARVGDLLHAGLTRADASARRVPDLAKGWESPDSRTLVFHLRDDFHFPGGATVTADDVRATYEAVLDPALASPKRTALAMLERVDAPDARTVVMRLREPYAPLLDATGLGILPASRAREAGEVTEGAGPFRLVSAEQGERLLLAPNPGYPRRADRPPLDPLVIRIVPDEVVRVLELARGGVQLLEDAPQPEMVDWLAARPGLRVERMPGTSFAYLALNLRDPRLADRRVREALALALDRERLVHAVLGGAARPATGLLAPEHWAFSAAPAWRHDPRRARRLLERAGLGSGLRLVYKTTAQSGRRRLAEAIQADLATVGIRLDIRLYEWGTLYADVRHGNFEISALAWVGVGDPDLFRLAFHSRMTPPDGYNRGAYASPIVDRLTAAGRATLDVEERRRIYGRVQRRLARDLPIVPLWWEDRVVIETTRLAGFAPTPSGDLRGLADAWLD